MVSTTSECGKGLDHVRVQLGIAHDVHNEVRGGVEEADDVLMLRPGEKVLDVEVPFRGDPGTRLSSCIKVLTFSILT